MREPSLGNWTGCIIVLSNELHNNPATKYALKYMSCLNAHLLDITNDPLKDQFPHVYFWKNYILLHPFFRSPIFRNILYIDSDVITVKPMKSLFKRIISNMKKHHWAAWREDYRHQSMYKAGFNLNAYDKKTLSDFKSEFPDYKEAKQANVAMFNMKRIPSIEYIQSEINRLYNKYGKGFTRHDQSLWNLLLYYNSTDLSFTAFNTPPPEKLFYPPNDYFPMVHPGGYQAMNVPHKGWYHVLHQFWMFKLYKECPEIS